MTEPIPEMVERVARALEAHARDTYRGTDVMTMLPPDWEAWIGPARAVIEAMRQPTEAIYLARPILIPKREDWDFFWSGIVDAMLEGKAPAGVLGVPVCPFEGPADPGLRPQDPCPVCGDLGMHPREDDPPSRCVAP